MEAIQYSSLRIFSKRKTECLVNVLAYIDSPQGETTSAITRGKLHATWLASMYIRKYCQRMLTSANAQVMSRHLSLLAFVLQSSAIVVHCTAERDQYRKLL